MGLKDRFQRAWNVFLNNRDPTSPSWNRGYFNSYRPDRVRFSGGNERSIVTAVYNRIAMDAAAIDIKHVRLDENERYKETVKSDLNECLTVSANLDQTGRAFMQDVFMSMLDEGCIAIVPVDADVDPKDTESYKILSLRCGKILEWQPTKVRVQLYNERIGQKQDVWVPKSTTAIIENPLYAVINERNSTMQRLIRKLNLLDAIDEQSGSGKLDLIIQLPYITKTDTKKQQAEDRIKRIEEQLTGKFGIAYTDATEKVVQLNRPVENNLMKQIEYLTSMLYSQLGITQSILDGTANEETMRNYYSRTIEPMISAVVDEMKRKFLSKTARTKGQSIKFFRDMFTLVPVSVLSDVGYKFKTAGVLSTNDLREILGKKPSDDPQADSLTNSTMKQSGGEQTPNAETTNDKSLEEYEDVDRSVVEGES